jgi:7-keto-8-aminopelargonate synthetase-like enzyme
MRGPQADQLRSYDYLGLNREPGVAAAAKDIIVDFERCACLTKLKAFGEARSALWIADHFQDLAQRSTADYSLYL